MENKEDHTRDMEKILHAFEDHAEKDDVRFASIEATMKDIKTKGDEVHTLLTQAKAVGGFFSGIKSVAGWLLVIGALFALMKGWATHFISWLIIK